MCIFFPIIHDALFLMCLIHGQETWGNKQTDFIHRTVVNVRHNDRSFSATTDLQEIPCSVSEVVKTQNG